MAELENTLRNQLESMRTLGTQPSVAARLIEMGKDPDTELDDYVDLVSLCQSLSFKLIAFANSSWFSPRSPITTVKRALGMIGMNQVRALSISYCLEAMHSRMGIEREDADAYWRASLCKAVAAKRLADLHNKKRADEAFAVALLADMGLAPMIAASPEYAADLQNPAFHVEEQLRYEQEKFGMTHVQAGGMLAASFDLPLIYSELIGKHHAIGNQEIEPTEDPVSAAIHTVSFMPHDIRNWIGGDTEKLEVELQRLYPEKWESAQTLVEEVQEEFAKMIEQFGHGVAGSIVLKDLLAEASSENAMQTSHLTGQLQLMAANADRLTGLVNEISIEQEQIQKLAEQDKLTGLLNRVGFERWANEKIEQAIANGHSLGLAFFDCNNFKQINDTHGHAAGDATLKTVAARIKAAVRDHIDVVGRWGGDEILVLLVGLKEDECVEVARRMQTSIIGEPIMLQGKPQQVSIAGGLCWIGDPDRGTTLENMVTAADHHLYEAKSTNPNALSVTGTSDRMVA